MKRSIFVTAIAALLAAGPAFAGSYKDPAPAPGFPHTPAEPSWTAFYLGSQIGYLDADSNIPVVSGDDFIAGFTAGYDHDFGDFVLGAGIDYDWTQTTLFPGFDLENVFRVKMRGGFKMGRSLIYATGGYAHADTNLLGDDEGYFLGAGIDYLFSDTMSVGAEILYHEFDNYNNTVLDLEATTVQVRTVYRF